MDLAMIAAVLAFVAVGAWVTEQPFTPERVLAAIRDAATR